MSKSPLKLLVILIFIFGSFVFLNKSLSLHFGQNSLAGIFGGLSLFKKTVSSITTVSKLTQQKMELERNNFELLSKIAELDNIRSENEVLRKILRIREINNYKLSLGNIYTWSSGADGYTVLLNKGSSAGVSEGDIVISGEQILIGVVSEVQKNFSKILTVTDPDFKATAKVLGLNTVGIVNGALSDGLYFDLITQNDPIKDGDIVVTSGNDIFPNSLVIGQVRKVEFRENQVFKKVFIEPAAADIILSKVIILHK